MPVTPVNRQVISTILGFQTSDGSVFDDAIDAHTYEIAYFEQKKAATKLMQRMTTCAQSCFLEEDALRNLKNSV